MFDNTILGALQDALAGQDEGGLAITTEGPRGGAGGRAAEPLGTGHGVRARHRRPGAPSSDRTGERPEGLGLEATEGDDTVQI